MSAGTTVGSSNGSAATTSKSSWRTVDVVVAAVLGVAFGVLQAVWNNGVYPPLSTAMGAVPQLTSVQGGIWLIAGVVGALVVRKPGAAFFTEMVAVLVAAAIGSSWGLSVIWYGAVEGFAPELVFLATRYKRFGLPTSVLAGAAAGLSMAVLDLIFYYPTFSAANKLVYTVVAVGAAAVTAGALAWVLVRALASTGVLAPLASGRAQREV